MNSGVITGVNIAMRRGARSVRLAGALLLGAVLSSQGCTSVPAIRETVDGETGVLEVGWMEFTPPAGRPPVLLVNMVHFGEREFYTAAQDALDHAGVVLMEGIRPARHGMAPDEAPAVTAAGAEVSPVQRLGIALSTLARQVRLVAQHDVLIDRNEWKHVDFTEDGLLRTTSLDDYLAAAELWKNLVATSITGALRELQHAHPEMSDDEIEEGVRRGALRASLARGLTRPAGRQPVVIDARNEALLGVLDHVTTEGRVAVCYGVDHAPGLASGLEKRGYTLAHTAWYRVFAWGPR